MEKLAMAFGSYDESEQGEAAATVDADDGETVNVHQHDYDGELTVEGGTSTSALLGQLEEIKANKDD